MLEEWPQTFDRPLLGANGTEAMQSLLEEGHLDLVDYLKVGPFMGEEIIQDLGAQYPLLLHLDDTLSVESLSRTTIAAIQGWMALTDSPWASEHIGFGVADVGLDEALTTQPFSALLSQSEVLERIVANARQLASNLSRPLLLENLPLFPNMAHIHICEPRFISAVIEASDCDLLLDLAHARVAADILGYKVHEYLEALPLERTVEIHLSGPRRLHELTPDRQRYIHANAASVAHLISFDENNLVDAHEPLRERDYALLRWTLRRCQPKAISLEYYYEPFALAEQLDRLREILAY